LTAAGFGNAGWNSSASPSLGVQVAGGSGTLPFESTLGMPHARARPCVVSRRSQHESLHDLFCCDPSCVWRPVGLPSIRVLLTTVPVPPPGPRPFAHRYALPSFELLLSKVERAAQSRSESTLARKSSRGAPLNDGELEVGDGGRVACVGANERPLGARRLMPRELATVCACWRAARGLDHHL
jgi:hypothetical protein